MRKIHHSILIIMLAFFIVLLTSCKDYSKCIFIESSSLYLLPSEDNNSYEAYGVKDTQRETYYIPNEYEGKPIVAISFRAFINCYDLTSITIPSNVTKIGREAFRNCGRLRDVVLNEGLISIEYDAFQSCYNLMSITIPSTVTTINDPFNSCPKLLEIYNLSNVKMNETLKFSNVNTVVHTSMDEESILTKDDGFIFTHIKNRHYDRYYLLGYVGEDDELILPSSFKYNNETITEYHIYEYAFRSNNKIKTITTSKAINRIEGSAFEYCTNLESIIILGNLEKLESSLFRGCSKLKDVILPNSLIEIGGDAFQYCSNLTEIKLPNNLTKIEYSAFRETKLKNIVIPEGVTLIDDFAFYGSTLESITLPSSLVELGSAVFLDTKLKDIYYAGSEELWKTIKIGVSQNEILGKVNIHYNSK